jgi:S-adenosylmethionine uptake transporter
MLLASFLFASMGVCVKLASDNFTSGELVFWRGVIGVVFMGLYAKQRKISLATTVPWMHIWRSVVGVASLSAWFYALTKLPLATAMTLNYMSSVWIAAFLVGGALIYKNAEKQGALVMTVLAGFAGVVLILRPTIEQNQMFAGLIGLLSGMGAALAYMQVMALSRMGEPEARVVFYFALGTVLAGGLAMALTGVSPTEHYTDWRTVVWLLPVGILASVGQLCMTRAYASGATLVVANLQYSGIVFSVIYSLAFFGDQISGMGWLGIALIVASGITATALRARAAPDAPAEEH